MLTNSGDFDHVVHFAGEVSVDAFVTASFFYLGAYDLKKDY